MLVATLLLLAVAALAPARLSAHAQQHSRTARPSPPAAAAARVEPSPSEHTVTIGGELPGGLAPGACVAFDPTGVDQHRTVFVDPGHGGPDPGAVGGQVAEKTLTLAVALQLKDMLRADGFRVVLSRTSDSLVAALAPAQVQQGAVTNSGVHLDTVARILCANAARADVMVSIHFNAFDDPSVGGAETFYDDARTFAAGNLRLAGLVQAGLLASYRRTGWTVEDRGVVSDAATGSTGLTATADAYGRLLELGPPSQGWNDNPSAMPGVLVEPFFVTDPVEAEVASQLDGRKAIAAGIEQGIIGFLIGGASG